jgi:hypothetical protein
MQQVCLRSNVVGKERHGHSCRPDREGSSLRAAAEVCDDASSCACALSSAVSQLPHRFLRPVLAAQAEISPRPCLMRHSINLHRRGWTVDATLRDLRNE